MDKSSELLIENLSSTLEELNLDRRAYHLLKRVSIYHVSQIITLGEMRILNIKGMGTKLANHIFSAVAKHLNIPENELFSEKTVRITIFSYKDKDFDPLDYPISVLGLTSSTLKSLNSIGVFKIHELLKLKAESVINYDRAGLRIIEIRKIYTLLNNYLSRYGLDDIQLKTVTPRHTNSATPKSTTTSITNLEVIFAILFKNERTLQIVELRGNQLLTLEEIAVKTGGVTRERIRQIISNVYERIQENLNLLIPFCDFLEVENKNTEEVLKHKDFTLGNLIERCKTQFSDSEFIATEKEIEILIAIIRLLAVHQKPWSQEFIQKRCINFSIIACVAKPTIEKQETLKKILEDRDKKTSYKELALLILKHEKQPMHWLEISERAYHMGKRDSFSSTALYNALMNFPDTFVRVDTGTYALVEWGISQADYYPNIIASILQSSNTPLSSDSIYHKVNEIRQVKQSTLIMLLDMHPRFYKSLEKTYGLRVWLLPREKQTLRTPESFIEDSDSYRRLELASQRGYDVENMLKVDAS